MYLLGLDSPKLFDYISRMSGRERMSSGISESRLRKRKEELSKYPTVEQVSNSYLNSIINIYEEDPEADKELSKVLSSRKRKKHKKVDDE